MAKLRHRKLRRQIIATCRAMNAEGINQGTSGNVSARVDGGFLVTPSGIPYDLMEPETIVQMDLAGGYVGDYLPSSEWRMHYDIYRARPEAAAVVHTHATFCTALACRHLEIPAFHYMIGVAGGTSIRCADYATFGTQALSDNMLEALEGRSACLLANHGMICFGADLRKALGLAVEVETLARQYWYAKRDGEPVILSDAEMRTVLARFKSYGKQRAELKPGEALAVEPPPRRDRPPGGTLKKVAKPPSKPRAKAAAKPKTARAKASKRKIAAVAKTAVPGRHSPTAAETPAASAAPPRRRRAKAGSAAE